MQTVAIIGRPNVGKSTLFNRLIGRQSAIVEDEPGVTRDRLYGTSEWTGREFVVIDTGGLVPFSDDVIESSVRQQAQFAVDEADVLLLVVDARAGLTPIDHDVADLLRKSGKPVVLVVNKADSEKFDADVAEFYSIGLGDPYAISAVNGRGTGDLLDEVVRILPDTGGEIQDDTKLKIALLGRPNVGKSSIANVLLGEERSIVTDAPGTTRDSIDSTIKFHGEEMVLVDTAGLRRRTSVKESVELYSAVRTMRSIDRCDVAILVIDAEVGFERQDARILREAIDRRKGVLIAVNKWDLIDKDSNTAATREQDIRDKIPTLSYVPVMFVSALTKKRIWHLIEVARSVRDERNKRIPTSELNNVLLKVLESHPPPAVRGKDLRINYIVQPQATPPVFLCFTNHPDLVPEHYTRYLEHQIRDRYGFMGTPLTIVYKQKDKMRRQQHSTATM